MRKIVLGFVCLCFFFTFRTSGFAAPVHEVRGDFDARESRQGRLVKILAKLLTPESMEVSFVGGPTEEGKIAAVRVEARGISAGTPYRLERIVLLGSLVELTPPSQWDVEKPKTLLPEKWEGFFNADVLVREKDVRDGLARFLQKEKSDKWRDISVDFRPGKLFVKGLYKVNSGMRALFEITTGLELRGGKQIWLVNTKVKVNDDEQTDAIRRELKKHNPPVDFAKLGVPLTLRTVKITNDALQVTTTTPPAPLDGETWRYTK